MLVEVRTRLINFARGITKTTGRRLPSADADRFSDRVRQGVPEALRPALLPLLNVLDQIAQDLIGYDENVQALAEERYPETRWLRQVPGVGTITALTFVLTLSDPARFARARDVGPLFGPGSAAPAIWPTGSASAYHQMRRPLPAPVAGAMRACAGGTIRSGLRFTALGVGSWGWKPHRQETHSGSCGA